MTGPNYAPRPLSAQALFELWDALAEKPTTERALALLDASYLNLDRAQAAQLNLGKRDDLLLRLRERLFGPKLEMTARCPECSEAYRIDLEVPDILAWSPKESAAPEYRTDVAGVTVAFRLANSLDVIAAQGATDAGYARNLLLTSCLIEPISTDDAPDTDILDAIGQELARLDPLAAVKLPLDCDDCGFEWRADFDIADFVWREVDAWANRLVYDISALAKTYGWSQTEILKMSTRLRRRYLEQATA